MSFWRVFWPLLSGLSGGIRCGAGTPFTVEAEAVPPAALLASGERFRGRTAQPRTGGRAGVHQGLSPALRPSRPLEVPAALGVKAKMPACGPRHLCSPTVHCAPAPPLSPLSRWMPSPHRASDKCRPRGPGRSAPFSPADVTPSRHQASLPQQAPSSRPGHTLFPQAVGARPAAAWRQCAAPRSFMRCSCGSRPASR